MPQFGSRKSLIDCRGQRVDSIVAQTEQLKYCVNSECTQFDSRGIYWRVSNLKKINQKCVGYMTKHSGKKRGSEQKAKRISIRESTHSSIKSGELSKHLQ